ncbi:MAG TPA: histidine phosphatase family protein [Gaiellaceae bacterium]
MGVIVYLVRHARAGHRSEWDGDDLHRPLDERGRQQAELLVGQLEGRELGRLVSSPYVRCVDTLVPLAEARGLEVELDDALAEGAGAGPALALFRAASSPLVASIHGDLAHALVGERTKKGSTAVLDVSADGVEVLERLAPQA